MKSLSVKLGVILIGLIIFEYAEVCRAEGAWVLWEKLNNWEITDGFPNYFICEKAQKSRFDVYNSYIEGKYGMDHRISSDIPHWISVDGKTIVEFKCLPDTIDPRK